ncbi:UDP-forming cellulose synthase catalytic subunit [uncultured Oxalicibacterium sp.]|uniref:UDP-forming cellulose synthase catalytic subunit n=1 Tax=uncultured Oxalicibacterium sp. TaxID=1168540 RepID=UPI0025FBF407|nr:UDP-forming cellulose synthase catalytic subunit [uncultured Oxalicibacterium sp.]
MEIFVSPQSTDEERSLTSPFWFRTVLWLATRLGVSDPGQLRCWLKALVLRPTDTAAIRVDQKQIARIPMRIAAHFGVRNYRSPGEWLRCLLFVPASQRLAHESIFRPGRLAMETTARSLDLGSRGALAMFGYVILFIQKIGDFMAARLPDVDFLNLEQRLDRVADSPLFAHPLIRVAALLLSLAVFGIVCTTPFSLQGQALFLLALWTAAMFIRRIPGNMSKLILIGLSLFASFRYAWWRITSTLNLDTGWEIFFSTLLLMAEIYTWLILLFGYIQTAWPLKRPSVALPTDVSTYPTVDIYIPTYNEPLAVVKPTVLAAKGMDWPQDKLRIFLLDDGRRPAFRAFAEEAGVEYIVRDNNRHAKAGNLNNALKITHGDFIAIFDCDHLPTRSFLHESIGWFERDPQCAMLQTPHHFFSPDPFERNLSTFRRVPNEGALFYGLIQDANDLWNATFFCGSCAVIRRAPLEEIGGIAVETVTEDAHTALKLHRLGYTTAYINTPLAAGLATESLSSHVGQRIRWARGMAQIFRIDNPFLGKGLSFFQRICYGNAMLHFFYGIPRLIFLTAPLAYLYFELHLINAAAAMIALYVAPHLIMANLANAHIQGAHRHTFWAEVYETVLAWYIALPTTIAMFNPSAGTFNVTAKGGLITREYFDWSISRPYILLIILNFGGLMAGIVRMFYLNTGEVGTVLLNMVWTLYNFLMLGVAVGVATETRQVRTAHRVTSRLPATLRLQDGSLISTFTQDYSLTGLGLELPGDPLLEVGDHVAISLWDKNIEHVFPAHVIVRKAGSVGLQFDPLTNEQEAKLVQCTFARADAWVGWKNDQDADRPMQGLHEIFTLGVVGYRKLLHILSEGFKSRQSELFALLGKRFGR